MKIYLNNIKTIKLNKINHFLTAQNHPAVAFYLPIGGQTRCLKLLEFSHQLTHKAFDPFENYKIKKIIFE